VPDPAADRNLLFGILALQMDFVSREALVAAMHAWVLDKGKPLGQILHEQGVLSAERLALLDALLQEHLKQHGNDPEKSLAALSSVGSVRRDLQQVPDADVQASLAQVFADRPAHDPDATRADTASPSARRFLILRPHAKGGLGEVFVARDEELRREVALKEIQDKHADNPESRARFLLEAEVTGGLEHPGIVPVYGLGTYGDGRPFYAMRFVKGDSLKDTIQSYHKEKPTLPAGERLLRLRQLLGRFVDVCQAVAYAHSRGVLHRDLKPGNIMLGRYGETLVVDWGLAKVTGQADVEVTEGLLVSSADSALTQAGKALGTPAYMSPEQAAGHLDQLGPRSDVYSLGATLYCLLTGQAPFPSGDAGEVLGKVQRGDYPRPRELDPRMHPALEAVCRKAMALRPEDRYPSPQALAEDLEKFLADEPVTAYREPLPTRLARWRRRHNTLVTASVLVLFTLIGAAVVGGLVVGREQERARAESLAEVIVTAETADVPRLVEQLRGYRHWANPRLLRHLQDSPEDTKEHLHASLALASVDGSQVEYLSKRLLHAGPAEVAVIRDTLHPYRDALNEQLWGVLEDRNGDPDQRLRVACALARFGPDDPRWEKVGGDVAAKLVTENALVLGQWVNALRPVGGVLLPALAPFLEDEKRSAEQRRTIAGVYGTYAADTPDAFAPLENRLAVECGPNAADDAKVDLARRQANIGVALVLMGRGDKVWPLLKHSPDPTRRSYLIDRLAPGGVAARVLIDRLDGHTEVSVRRALLLALGEYDPERLLPAERDGLVGRLAALYRDDPDPGVHGAAGWLLRQWGQPAKVEDIDRVLPTGKPEGNRQWYVNGQGQTLVIVPPGEFDMGDGPARKRVQMNYSFALAARDVTVAEFRRFRKGHGYVKVYAPTEDCPVNGVSWYDAAVYCNWLSKQEGIAQGQWCYLPNEKGNYAEGMKVAADWRKRSGYRLPTEAEWEYACRAGSVTPWSMGTAEELLPKYAWFLANASGRSQPVSSLRPNDWGLFDMHGNVWQWCQDRFVDDTERAQAPVDKGALEDKVDDKNIRLLRGGAFRDLPLVVRSTYRSRDAPAFRLYFLGFRPARTFR
jgi:formylglycine-generating enzyme required for sulfatase activity/serine/threonine protein kinase